MKFRPASYAVFLHPSWISWVSGLSFGHHFGGIFNKFQVFLANCGTIDFERPYNDFAWFLKSRTSRKGPKIAKNANRNVLFFLIPKNTAAFRLFQFFLICRARFGPPGEAKISFFLGLGLPGACTYPGRAPGPIWMSFWVSFWLQNESMIAFLGTLFYDLTGHLWCGFASKPASQPASRHSKPVAQGGPAAGAKP